MLIKAIICDHDHLECGLVTIPLPIPDEHSMTSASKGCSPWGSATL